MTWRKRSVSTAGDDKALQGYSGGAVRPQGEERDDDRRERDHAELPPQDRDDDRPLSRLVQPADRARVLQAARVEDGLRRRGAELLGDEAHRDRQERVEPEEPGGRAETRRGRDAGRGGERDGGRLAGAREHPERARRRHGPPPPRAEQADDHVDGGGHERRGG